MADDSDLTLPDLDVLRGIDIAKILRDARRPRLAPDVSEAERRAAELSGVRPGFDPSTTLGL